MNANVGSITYLARIDSGKLKSDAKDVESTVDGVGKASEKTATRSNSAFNSIAKVGLAAIAAAAVAAGAAIVGNVGNAIRRVDTLNNSRRTFENMGFQAQDVSKAMGALEKSVMGLPTPLDAAVRGMTSLAATYGDVSLGQKTFTALNNAVIGFGGTAAMAENAILQLSQMPMDGPLDAQTWNSLRNSGLTPVMVAMAKDMGKSVSQMKEEFGEGILTVEDFVNALIRMDTEGGGGMKSLQAIAKDATAGIGTGWENLQTAITRGIASVIEAIGSENISTAISNLGKSLETTLKNMVSFIEFIKRNQGVIAPIAVAITSVVAAATAWFAITKAITIAQAALNIVLAANPIGLIILAVVGLVSAIVYLWKTNEGFRNFFTKAWQGIKNVISAVWNWIKANWPKLLGILMGPIGLAVGLIIKNFSKIKSAAVSVWNWIRGAFNRIGDIASSIFREAVNFVLGFAGRVINGFIRNINTVIGLINKIPGVNVGTIGGVNIPRLATGGIVTSPTLAEIGEGGEPEAVIPLSKLDDMMGGGTKGAGVTINVDMQGIMTRSRSDMREVARDLVKSLNEELTSKGLKPIGEGAI